MASRAEPSGNRHRHGVLPVPFVQLVPYVASSRKSLPSTPASSGACLCWLQLLRSQDMLNCDEAENTFENEAGLAGAAQGAHFIYLLTVRIEPLDYQIDGPKAQRR